MDPISTNSTLNDLLQIAQGGGNVALILCVYFIRDASQRLARIEMRLDVALGGRRMATKRKMGDDDGEI